MVEVEIKQDRGVLPLWLVLMDLTFMPMVLAMMMMEEDMEGVPTSMDQEAGEDTTEVELGPPISLSVLVVEVNECVSQCSKQASISKNYVLPL